MNRVRSVTEALCALEGARDQVAGDLVVERLLRRPFATDPEGVIKVLTAEAAGPRAAFALWKLAPEATLRLVGPEAAAAAYVRWEQPEVLEWWDGWSRLALVSAIEEWPAEDVLPFLMAIVISRPPPDVMAWFETMLLTDVVAYRSDDLLPLLSERAESHDGLRAALDTAIAEAGDDRSR